MIRAHVHVSLQEGLQVPILHQLQDCRCLHAVGGPLYMLNWPESVQHVQISVWILLCSVCSYTLLPSSFSVMCIRFNQCQGTTYCNELYELVLVVIIYSSCPPASMQMFTTPVDRPASPLLSAGYCPPEGDGAPMMVLELMNYGDTN